MKRFLRDNGLSVTMFGLFFLFLIGQTLAGFFTYNDDQKEHHQPPVAFAHYFATGHFIEAVFENWESEFLQMGAFVVLTIFLQQKGGAESKDLDGPAEPVDEDCEEGKDKPDAPGPVRRGGFGAKLYQNSLSLALFGLFFLSFALHAVGGAKEYNEEQQEHGQPAVTTMQFIGTSEFWFQSFQNWQSEFLSVGALIVLSIYLRQKGSPESKPISAPHDQTGSN